MIFGYLAFEMSTSALSQHVCFILVEPAHPGNIGSAARAIKTMGFRDLRVVSPWEENYRTHPEAIAYSTSSVDVLQSSRSYGSLLEALEGVHFAWAMSGYDREFGPVIEPVRAVAEKAVDFVKAEQGNIAFVFGCERTGLSNEQMAMCQGCAAIPADPDCTSLNLSQAVQIMAYEMHMAMMDKTITHDGLYEWQERFAGEKLAGPQAIEGFLAHFEEAMIHCGVLDPKEPKLFMPRVRRLFSRTQLTQPEVDLLRGVCSQIISPKNERSGKKCPKK